MDPHQLNSQQLDYEILLRDIATYGAPRRRAELLKQHLANESSGDRTLEHLYQLPIAPDEDLLECQNSCRYLDKEARKGRIDSQTLDMLWSRVVHVIARLNRIITAGDHMRRERFELLYWAENIRKKIEEQKNPYADFTPCVNIDERYHRTPALAAIIDVSEEESAPPRADNAAMDEISEKLRDFHTMSQLFDSSSANSPPVSDMAVSRTDNTAVTTTTSTIPYSGIQQGATSTPIRSEPGSQSIIQRPIMATTRWRDPRITSETDRWDLRDKIRRTTPPNQRDPRTTEAIVTTEPSNELIQFGDNAPPTTAASKAITMNTIVASTAAIPKYTGTIPRIPFSYSNVNTSTTCGPTTRPSLNSTYTMAKAAPIMSCQAQPVTSTVVPAREYSAAVREAIRQRKQQREERQSVPNMNHNLRLSSDNTSPTIGSQAREANCTRYSMPHTSADPRGMAVVKDAAIPVSAHAKIGASTHAHRPWPITEVYAAPTSHWWQPQYPSYWGHPNNPSYAQANFCVPQFRPIAQASGANVPTPMRQPAEEAPTTRDGQRSRDSGTEIRSINPRLDRGNRRTRHSGNEQSEATHGGNRTTSRRDNVQQLPRQGVRRPTSPSDSSPSSSEDYDGRRRRNGYRTRNRERRREPTLKPVPVNQWRISFSGDTNPSNKHDLNIHNFIEQVELFRRASSISEADLLLQIIHLLAGSARAWFQNESRHLHTWYQFVRALRTNFLPSDYNFELIAQATQRRQRRSESVAEYVNAMELIFRAMSVRMSPEHQLYLVRQNLLPQYGVIVASHSPRNVAEVKRICKEIESATAMQNRRDAGTPKSTSSKDRPNHRAVHAAENVDETDGHKNSNASSDSEMETGNCAAARFNDSQKKNKGRTESTKKAVDSSKMPKSSSNQVEACYNCRGSGHTQMQCKLKWKKHCYNCGMPDYVTKDCPVCNEEKSKNAKVNQVEVEPEDSQNDSAS